MRRLVTVLVLLLAVTARPRAEDAAWWRNPQAQETLHLSPQQITRLEQIFHQDVALRTSRRRTLTRLEAEFTEAMNDGDVARIESTHLIDRIEQLRVRINVRRTMMLVEMYQILSPDQRTALATLHPPAR